MLSLLAAAVASSLGAGPTPGAVDSMEPRRVVQMPTSVSEAAPMSVATTVEVPREAIGRASDASASGTASYTSSGNSEVVEYWKIDEVPGD